MTTVELFVTEVGHTAGDIWQLLDHKGSLSITEIVKAIDKPRDQIMQSIGWLARVGKLTVQAEGQRKIVTLLIERIGFHFSLCLTYPNDLGQPSRTAISCRPSSEFFQFLDGNRARWCPHNRPPIRRRSKFFASTQPMAQTARL